MCWSREGTYPLGELKKLFSATELRLAAFSSKEMREAGFALTALKEGGFSPDDLRGGAGYYCSEMKQVGGYPATPNALPSSYSFPSPHTLPPLPPTGWFHHRPAQDRRLLGLRDAHRWLLRKSDEGRGLLGQKGARLPTLSLTRPDDS